MWQHSFKPNSFSKKSNECSHTSAICIMLSTGKPWPLCPLLQTVTILWIFQTYYSTAEVLPTADAREAYFVIWQSSMLSHLTSKMQDRILWTCDEVDVFGTESNKPNLHYSSNRLNLVNAVKITNLLCSYPPPWQKYWNLNTVLCTREPSSFVIMKWYTQGEGAFIQHI